MNILVRAPNWVGDCLLATPFFSLLRERYPEAFVTALAAERAAPVLRGHPAINEILAFQNNAQILAYCRARRYEVAYILPDSFSSSLFVFLSGIPRRIGYAAQGRAWTLTQAIPKPAREHRALSYARLVDAEIREEDFTPRRYPVFFNLPMDCGSVFPEAAGEKLVALNPCSQFPSRRWSAARYAQLAHKLVQDAGAKLLLVGGPHAQERALAEHVEREAGVPVLNLAGRTTLEELACVLRRARVLVTSDTGIMHMASAVQTPTIVLAGAGDMVVTSPWSENFTVIDKQVYCSPCVSNFCVNREKPMLCMESIEVQDVFEAVKKFLEFGG